MAQIVVLVLLVLLNAFFAASEMAFVSLNDTKISVKAKEGDKKYKKIEKNKGLCLTKVLKWCSFMFKQETV